MLKFYFVLLLHNYFIKATRPRLASLTYGLTLVSSELDFRCLNSLNSKLRVKLFIGKMALLLTRILALVLLCYQFTNAVGGLPKTQLIKAMSEDLLKNYSKHIVPSETEPFNVTVHVDLLSLGEIDELEEKLSSVFWMNFNWLDENINWDKNQTNASYITLSYNEVWTPIFRVGNPHADVSKSQSVDRSYDVVLYNSVGKAYYDEMMTTRTTCDLDMTYFPFDVQSCSVMLTLVGFIQFWFRLDVSMHESFSEEDANHGSWRLLNTSVTTKNGGLKINLVFERKPLFLLINILLPIIVLATLTPLVFVLPKKSGERVGYAITMLLAISVYMTIVSDNLPKNSQPMPLISIMIFIWYILDAVIVFGGACAMRPQCNNDKFRFTMM
ncbi:5-hydroxytryptamine receptor 3A-like [Ruditapes philippinarum]|uniref:5-hydroxytryptamine receptor 3A-like n=1 Tax=Ruditapes philippinarum TaxID=129788 RepID=UPI00295B5F36|nr:5-hydroxytryptamine receptor 3A-like [Ruditapes philippinarum]